MNQEISSDLKPALEHLRESLKSVRTGRASTGLVEEIAVDYYGTETRLKDIASISTPDARTIQIDAWDKNAITAIERAIETSSLGLNPATNGGMVRLSIPPLTEERREELAKLVRQYAEEARISLRNIREKLMQDLKKLHQDKDLSDDEFNKKKGDLEKEVEKAVQEVESMAGEKEREVLGK